MGTLSLDPVLLLPLTKPYCPLPPYPLGPFNISDVRCDPAAYPTGGPPVSGIREP